MAITKWKASSASSSFRPAAPLQSETGAKSLMNIYTATGEAHGRKTLTITQAMLRCCVARRTIYNWMAQGKIQFVRTPGGKVRIFEDSLFTGHVDALRVTVTEVSSPARHKDNWSR